MTVGKQTSILTVTVTSPREYKKVCQNSFKVVF